MEEESFQLLINNFCIHSDLPLNLGISTCKEKNLLGNLILKLDELVSCETLKWFSRYISTFLKKRLYTFLFLFSQMMKACAHYFLFFTKWQLFRNYEKCDLFHLKASFSSRNVQIFTFPPSFPHFPDVIFGIIKKLLYITSSDFVK